MLIFSDESTDWPIKVVGAVSISEEENLLLEEKIQKLRLEHSDYKEIKWNELPISRSDFYNSAIDVFMSIESARFHSTSYSYQQLQHDVQRKLCGNTISWKMQEAGLDGNLKIFVHKVSKKSVEKVKRMNDKLCLERENGRTSLRPSMHHDIEKCEEVESSVSTAMQLADYFTGCVGYELNVGKSKKCLRTDYKDILISNLVFADIGEPLSHSSNNPHAKWDYFERKFQHYNLQVRP